MISRILNLGAIACALAFSATAQIETETSAPAAPPPVEVYGELPAIRFMEVSPDGKHIAWVQASPEGEYFVVKSLETGATVDGFRLGNFFPTGITFPTRKHAVISGSQVVDRVIFRDEWDFTSALALNLETGKRAQLFDGMRGITPQSGLGDILGPGKDENEVMMSAFTSPRSTTRGTLGNTESRYSLYSIDLDTGRGRKVERGNRNVRAWTTAGEGKAIAYTTYNNDADVFQMYAQEDGKWVKVFEDTEAERPRFSVVGKIPDGEDFLLMTRSGATNGIGIFSMGMDGEYKGPHFYQEGREIEQLLLTRDNRLIGIEYSGLKPDYHLFDERFDNIVDQIGESFPDAAVRVESWTDDWGFVVFSIDGPNNPGAFYLFNSETSELQFLNDPRPSLDTSMIAKVSVLEYTAGDGLELDALVTWPLGQVDGSNLPTIIHPHGGPGAYDKIGFDWMAQYFASRGYLVVQPNFRGSTGFGQDLYNAGHGEWGKKMQSDLSDALAQLTSDGHADPERVCIVGASYGGYAALAGGAFTPELYDCVVAIAPVSDIPEMMSEVRRSSGRSHWLVDYWRELTVNEGGRDSMKAVSPARYAENFQAPVLLIHGRDDTVVEEEQSRIMERALRRAGKPVEFISQRNGDHWLTARETRLETLLAAGEFVDRHIGQ